MKLKSISFSDIITIICTVLSTTTGFISSETKNQMIDEIALNWPHFLFWGGIIGFICKIIHISLKVKIEGKFEQLERINQSLRDALDYSQRHHTLTGRIMREIVLHSYMMNPENKDTIAQILYENNHNKDDLRKWGMDEEIINKMLLKYHKGKLNEIESNS